MTLCQHTGIAIPECACPKCVERQLEQFAPGLIRVRQTRRHDPLRIDEVRSASVLPPISERLTRPAI
jgi:hypothetical protein